MKKHKIYSVINISGLAISMACCFLITLWVLDELSFDKFHKNTSNIYRIVGDWVKYNWNGLAGTPAPLAPAIKEEISDIIQVARILERPRQVFRYKNKVFYESGGIIADPSFFEIFSFSFVKGNPKTSFSKPTDIVITESLAQKYFVDDDPFGKILEVDREIMTVSGVINDIPYNSHLQFDYISSSSYSESFHWGAFVTLSYILLEKKKNLNVQRISSMITEIAKNKGCPQVQMGATFRLQPLSEIYLNAGSTTKPFVILGNSKYVYLFSFVAFWVLLIACINFMNLSTARSSFRAKEIGIRKTIGASRFQLVRQFLGESILLTIISCVFAIILVYLFLPALNQLSMKNLNLQLLNPVNMAGLLAFMIFTGFLAGSYPAFYLSGFNPIFVLKRSLNVGEKKVSFRKMMVVFQFTLSISLIIGTAVVYKQLNFIRNKKLEFTKENIICIPIKEDSGKSYDALKIELLRNPNIFSVTAQNYLLAKNHFHTTGVSWEGKDPDYVQDVIWQFVDYDFIETLNLELHEGRFFSKEFASDGDAFILNEEAVKQMAIESPLGKSFTFYFSRNNFRKGNIIGILKNIHFRSLHYKIEPQVFMLNRDWSKATYMGVILIKISGEKVNQAIAGIRDIWEKFNPNLPFEYEFLDQTYAKLYRTEERVKAVLNYFSFLAILLSCLGLFGMASFLMEKRTKEIGIRKVFGAPDLNIIFHLTWDFLKWVLVANIIAWPLGYYAMNKMLQIFAYRINIGFDVFILSGGIVLVIALFAVSYHTIKTAFANPVDSLRYE